MKRNKKIALVSHCILNANSKVEGLSEYGGVLKDVMMYLMDEGYGIIQMPCPEMAIYGIKRWGHVKEQFDTPHFRNVSRKLFQPILEQVQDYIKNGYEVSLLIGIDKSPSCGINETCSSKEWGGYSSNGNMAEKVEKLEMIPEKGIFMDEILKILNENEITIKCVAIDEENIENSLEYLKRFI
ncbi:putative secreted protein [Methanococcus maripaludis]|uniref:Putative secreted protein n=1 Tax=Methanococcus maripaludis TaxID=39152 RepID=A0A7J9S691_METMI|nr:CD3072 family TudS-related putative desulfidase [Methanococcus maripaludis]MBA2841069.1 putative secreted protein [Methanococcus maripaludis]MBA2869662.1 putative secreted protein [Methanococcus maripaludis]MBB6402307.1 putative secreted protein [Methanococcus maripaludis]